MDKRPLAWPHGKRVAVVCSVLLETWSEGKAPSYFPRTTPLPPGSKDVAGINWSRFGGNEGIWRLSRNLKSLDIPATLFCKGRSAEVWPDAVSAFVKSGNDIAGHGYLQDQTLFSMSADRERETIKKTLDILEKTTGKRPAGWVTPIYGWSENTIDYLAEAKLAWCSDARCQRAVSASEQERQDRHDPVERVRRQPCVAGEPAHLFRCLQGHVRLSARLRARRTDPHRRALPCRRAPGDGRGVSPAPGISAQPQERLVRPSCRGGEVGRRSGVR
jgi:hypothetical protein